MSRPKAALAAVQLADRCRADSGRVWPQDGRMISADDVLDHLTGRTPDLVALAEACDLPPDTPAAEIIRRIREHLAERAGPR